MNTTSLPAIAPATSVVKRQPARGLISLDEPVEARLIDRQDVLLQSVDLLLVDIRADDLISRLGEARARRPARRSPFRRR